MILGDNGNVANWTPRATPAIGNNVYSPSYVFISHKSILLISSSGIPISSYIFSKIILCTGSPILNPAAFEADKP